jgi:hypothetical protein
MERKSTTYGFGASLAHNILICKGPKNDLKLGHKDKKRSWILPASRKSTQSLLPSKIPGKPQKLLNETSGTGEIGFLSTSPHLEGQPSTRQVESSVLSRLRPEFECAQFTGILLLWAISHLQSGCGSSETGRPVGHGMVSQRRNAATARSLRLSWKDQGGYDIIGGPACISFGQMTSGLHGVPGRPTILQESARRHNGRPTKPLRRPSGN